MKKTIIILAVFVTVFVAYFAVKGAEFYKGIYKNGSAQLHSIQPVDKKIFNILLLGYGGFDAKGIPHDGTYLTDSMMVASIDIEKNKVSLISLPRDLWVKIPTKSGADYHAKINSIYQLGLFPKDYPDVDTTKYPETALVKKAVGDITGLQIDNYVTVDFLGFTKAIDILGGMVVDVQTTFDDYEYPLDGKEKELCDRESEFTQIEKYLKPGFDEEEKARLFKEKLELEKFFKDITDDPKVAFPCRYEHLHFDKGKTFMNGETALKYVRSRHSLQDGTDFGRAARQQQFVRAIKDRVLSVGMVTKVVPLLDELKKHIQMDISVDESKKFIGESVDLGKYKIINIHMSDSNYLKSSFSDYGEYILIPRTGADSWKEIHSIIQNGIMEITPTPSPTSSKK
ncbi:hypothetical protein COY90_01755 [Candidatus Roizmanbacteria bacterium CG_4_10_14_0_8_um_filter_39_9]|uniref:Cell envelope-related transcriptional attenuator domain-containing protein n=1 Tax=Candidatus Roizmanbacteria bacterium CG_4_10_14_0_8_um_filter_39_9 TaxID=1974829 RepID=A0A2M7QE96_9BACT|nr:MAG: hypothetical protein COY90_01755 [Candidatus Roizmanbacteria bacterium CG_4_10_14_0_8_um_filter_39_9]